MSTLPITSIFRSIQGEGHFVGYRAVFIRFAGCSVLGCSIRSSCDEAPWKATETLTAQQIARRAWELNPGGICILTGGEPTDHDTLPVVDLLRAYGMRVHLETSGVRSIDGWPLDWVTVSPKTTDYAQRMGHTLKIVVRPDMTFDDVLTIDAGTTFFHRYLQPLTAADGTSNIAQVLAMIDSGSNPGGRWALSTQAHKSWGVR